MVLLNVLDVAKSNGVFSLDMEINREIQEKWELVWNLAKKKLHPLFTDEQFYFLQNRLS